MPTIILRRDKSWRDFLAGYVVKIAGPKSFDLDFFRGQEKVFDVPPGRYTITVRSAWCQTAPTTARLGKGEKVTFEFGSNYSSQADLLFKAIFRSSDVLRIVQTRGRESP